MKVNHNTDDVTLLKLQISEQQQRIDYLENQIQSAELDNPLLSRVIGSFAVKHDDDRMGVGCWKKRRLCCNDKDRN